MSKPSTDRSRETFGLRLLRVSRLWRREANETLSRYNLSEATILPLMLLREGGEGLRQGALAAELGIEGPSLVRLLDQLAAEDLVERREDPSDRRARQVHLTDKGRAMLETIDEVLHDMRFRLLATAGRSELDACLAVFDGIETACRGESPAVDAA